MLFRSLVVVVELVVVGAVVEVVVEVVVVVGGFVVLVVVDVVVGPLKMAVYVALEAGVLIVWTCTPPSDQLLKV